MDKILSDMASTICLILLALSGLAALYGRRVEEHFSDPGNAAKAADAIKKFTRKGE